LHGVHALPEVRDQVLFERWLERRDGDAFAELARRHSGVVYDLAARALGDRTEAEDVLQEALLDLALARSRKPVEVGIAAWLVRFAVCRARNRRSSTQRRERRQRIVGARRAEEVMPDDTYELSDELEHVLARAEPEERLVLAMRYLHGWGYPHIASALSVSEGAARVRVHRALAAVRTRTADTRPGDESRVRGALAALPVIALDGVRFDGLLEGVIASAQARLGPAAGTVGGTTPAAEGSRFVSLGIKLIAGLALVVGLGASLAVSADPQRPVTVEVADRLLDAAPSATAQAVAQNAGGRSPSPSAGVPRPGDWDRGALRRLGRGESELDAVGAHLRRPPARPPTQEPPVRAPADDPTPAPSSGLSKTSRPTSRGACAARCAPASSDDERAGVFASPTMATPPASSGRSAPAHPESPVAVNPGATDRTVPANYAIPRPDRVGAGRTRVADLPPEQRELVHQAVALVQDLVHKNAARKAGLDPLARSHLALKRAKRKANRKYRRARRALRRAALDNDVALVEVMAYEAQKLSTVSTVLSLLVEASAPGAAPLDELRWPDGLDLEATLTNVVQVLSTPLPGGRLPDVLEGSAMGPPEDGAAFPDRLPDALQEGF